MSQEIITTWKQHLANGGQGQPSHNVNAAVERLMRHLLNTYSGALASEDLTTVLSPDGGAPATQAGIALSVIRELLHTHRITFDPNKVPSWVEFSRMYGDQIISS